jgi:hypothetical protein
MNGSRFDTLIRNLATRRLTRMQTLRGLVVSGIAALTGLRLVAEEADAKNRGKNKRTRKRRVCLCTAAGCTSKKVKNRSKVISKNTPCAYAGGCTTNPCAATVPPLGPPGCTPEPQSTTCAGNTLCGTTRANNCGQVVTCGCRSGQTCLNNGSCATPCEFGGAQCAGCAGDVDCSGSTTEGQTVCVRLALCPPVPDCASTSSCPLGFVCVSGCGCSRVAVCP